MDFLRQQFVIIQERLNSLTASQKMLAGTLVVIMAMTMLYWGKFASTQDRVPLFTTAMTEQQLAAAGTALGNAGIEYDSAGGQLRVPTDRRVEALGIASFALDGVIPTAEGGNPLDAVFDKLAPWSTQGEVKARMGGARVETLRQMMLSWPGVRGVILSINESSTGQLVPPPAGVSIAISTRPGANPAKLAKAAVAMVVPVVSNLDRNQVTVNVDGTPIISAGGGIDGQTASNDLLELKASYEADARKSIQSVYQIPGFTIEVTAEVNAERRESKISTVDPKQKISLPTETVTEKTTSTEAAPVGEPGAVPNTGLDANSAASASRAGSKTERSEERSENAWGKTETQVSTPAGAGKIVSAIARVPRQYFINEWKGRNNNAEPKSEEIEAYVQLGLTNMQKQIAHKLLITDLDNVSVTDTMMGYEDPAKLVSDTALAAGTGNTLSLLAGSHGKEVAIGALALTSLFMVGRMVKKSAPAAVAPLLTLDDMPDVSGKKNRKSGMFGGVDIAGEVAEGGSIMMGQELDEEVLETAQMVEQVSGFVKDNPDMTAQLLKRWMSRE